MSFSLGGITYTTPDEFALATFGNIDTVICQKGTFFYRVNKTYFSDASHRHHELYQPNHTTRCISTDGLDRLYIQPPSTLWVQSINHHVYISSPANKIFLYTGLNQTVQTDSTKNTTIIASAFVEWSMARLKDNIRPIPPITTDKPLLPRLYTQQGKDRLGFIVEESPSEIISTTLDEDGKEQHGINLMAVCALQQAKIDKLEERIKKLEAIIK